MTAAGLARWAVSLMPAMVPLFANAVALGQTHGLTLIVSNVVSAAAPSTTIEAWAFFEPEAYAFSAVHYDLSASADPGIFSDPEILMTRCMLECNPGTIGPDGDSVLQVGLFQLQFPDAGIAADTANPLLLWRVTWSTTDFTPRRIELATATSLFYLYTDVNGDGFDALDENFGEGFADIKVVPAPSALSAPMGAALIGLTRRRRSLATRTRGG